MSWVLLALLSPALWAISNVIDKFILSKRIKNPYSYAILFASLELIVAFSVYMLVPVSYVYPYSIVAIFIGMLTILAFLLYNKSMMVEEASRVVSLNYIFSTFFVVILSTIFLREILNSIKILGIILLVSGAVLISYRRIKYKKSILPAMKFILLFSTIVASSDIIDKYLLSYLDYWSLFFWVLLGAFTGELLLLTNKKIRRDFITIVKGLKIKTFLMITLNELLSVSGLILFYAAISIGYVSLVVTLSSVQPLYSFVYTLLISVFIPKILKEEINKSVILMKILSIILIITGTWLVVS